MTGSDPDAISVPVPDPTPAEPADGPAPTPLRAPRDGTPEPLTRPEQLAELAHGLADGTGPVALDAERASGYRYGGRAYLVQLRRADVGTALIDPVPLPDLSALEPGLSQAEWVLHAADQDLPCLAELGIKPNRLFDTELAGRLAGRPRVGLGPLVEDMLGLSLAKGHGADDWSRRPLPDSWLTYAALDVEVLIELRDALAQLLRDQDKWEWASQEFAAIATAPPRPPRVDPWRRTSGVHTLSDRRSLAVVRSLWRAREELARTRDRAPHRVLPDSAIVAAAVALPTTRAALVGLPVFSGPRQRTHARYWFAAVEEALALPAAELPPKRLKASGTPAANRWAHLDEAAADRLRRARTSLAELSERVEVPVENLMTPQLVRDVLWQPPAGDEWAAVLAAGGARPWQIDLVAPLLRAATARGGDRV